LLLAATLTACGSIRASVSGANRATLAPAGAAALALTSAHPRPCGSATTETQARAAGQVAVRIYRNELASAEVLADKRQVEHYGPLLKALERGDRASTAAAVTSLVFSHTHIVRLRVTRGRELLADVGGPQILAPVGGALRGGGRTLGHYQLSVQDDLGYVKLVGRFIGVPLVLRAATHTLPVEGTASGAPAKIPNLGPVHYRNATFEAFSFNAEAYPSGPLRISLLVPASGASSRRSCAEVRAAELGDVARRVASRFTLSPSNFSSYVKATTPLTGGLVYILSGTRQLAGSTRSAPHALPARGTVRYRGTTYEVFSFTAASSVGQVRVYQLIRM
jgi:hypothetical protein